MAAPSLSTQKIRKIETLIQAWKTKLTWQLLIERIEAELNIKTTRQTLNTYNSIKSAYDIKKQELRGKPTKEFIKFTKSDIDIYERINKLEAENEVLKRKVDSQLAFIRQIGFQAESNPALTQLLNKIKQSTVK
ncbi:hypothetical protein [Vibrio sp. V23_P3S9T160]|uniref:hypothetical protein n=1 Tax=Vibrio sp. V23_P3S9T160 TaxID=1938675 RepID=UPI001373768A|nr:hypothetical protein [Vibrio sp. V23_P3S9T160]NAW98557.1 hypothetical protein [Vibrio sp. V23_P3S9T160]